MDMDRGGGPPLGAGCCDSCCFPGAAAQRALQRPVPSAADPGAAWVTAALRRYGRLGDEERVSAVRLAELTKADPEGGAEILNGGGKSGTRLVRLHLDVEARSLDSPHPIRGTEQIELVHKLTQPQGSIPSGLKGFFERGMLWLVLGLRIDKSLRQEAVFYRDAAPALRRLGVPLPVVYHAEIEGGHRALGCCFLCCCCDCCCCSVGGATTRTSLLQEDLGARGLDSIHVMAPEAMPLPALRTAVQMLAKVHAWGWKGQPAAAAHRDQPPSLWSALITGQNPVQRSAVKSFATDG